MFKIGEFSKLAQVSIRMLRYYDETGLLKPAEVDRFTGYRLYSSQQLADLSKIVFLRDLGFSVAEIDAALDGWSDEHIAGQLKNKKRETQASIAALQEKLVRIEWAQKDILREKIAINYSVTIRSIPSYQVFSLRRVVADYYAEGPLWKEMSAFAQENHIPVSSNTFSIYHDAEYKERDVDIEICAPVAEMGQDAGVFTYRHTEPVPTMACTMVHGPFENIAGAFRAFAGWLQEHSQYAMGGHSRQIVHRGPWNEKDPSHYLTEIQIPLEKL